MNNRDHKATKIVLMVVLALLLVLLPFLVPSSLKTSAGAEGETVYTDLPVYEPVELENPDAGPAETIPDRWGNPVAVIRPHPEGVSTDPPGYLDSTISVRMEWRTITNSHGVPTPVLFTYVQIADPSQMRTAFAYDYAHEEQVYVHVLAKRYNAVLAFDGDWCQSRPDGLVVRNGTELRRKPYNRLDMTMDALIIDWNGDFHILQHPELEELEPYEGRIMHAFVFGPAMVIDGEVIFQYKNEYGTVGGMWLEKDTQRQVFCQMGPLSYLIITTEGEDSLSMGGFTGNEVAQIAHDCGALQAYNMDGGASAQTALFQGTELQWDGTPDYVYKRINDATIMPRRPVCDIIYFCTAEPGDP